ncbi:hypothetical protein AGMMS49942_19680 [Spirochaetia bacterium]|nr:hypothetical protein AGMMS49942_19680 [Spirochaetia bacterium]GHV80328.1 hypothetical protein AGMMS49944_21190 [Spirochaetia bacterium]
MTIPRVYLETTMFSFYYEKREGQRYQELKAQVRQVFDLIKAGKFEPYTSAYAMDELEAEPDIEKREKMKKLIEEYGIQFLGQSDEAERLAALYIQEEALPAAYPTDAAHIAITAVNGLDFIVSLNFGHIARPWTIERVRRVNARESYKGVGIYKPSEVLESEDSTGIHE